MFLKTHKKVVLVTNSNAYTVKKAQLWHCCNIQLQDNVPTYTTVPSKFIEGKQLRLFSSDMKVISILLYPTFFSPCDKVNWKEFCTPRTFLKASSVLGFFEAINLDSIGWLEE